MRHSIALLAAGCLAFVGAACAGTAATAPAPAASAATTDAIAPLPKIPFTRFRLPNGLTVVVSEDHKAPVVAVAVWYHVGSGREPVGKTGYAHLFEHLMFGSSGHRKGSYFAPLEKVGVTGMNGTTAQDRTNYFETVPTSAVDLALWLESDRMGWLLDGLTKATVDTQRGVVQNEKRQDENQPLGVVGDNVMSHAYPQNHPYHHSVVGSMKDLNAASINDFKHWFKTYYGPTNATLILVGDITPAQAKAKALKYFGNIPPGPPVSRVQPWIAPRTTSTSGTMYRHVPQIHLIREWNTPPFRSHDDELLNLAAWALGGSKTSRLYQRLVYQDKLADSVSVSQGSNEISSQFELEVTVKKGADLDKVKAAIADVWATFLKDGPTADELARAKTSIRAGFVRRMEAVGGFRGKATLLASSQVYQGDPDAWRKGVETMMHATPSQVKAVANQWVSKGDYSLTVYPATKQHPPTTSEEADAGGLGPVKHEAAKVMPPKHHWHTVKSSVDRSKGVPEVTSFPALTFPKIQHATLNNGIKVTLAQRTAVPLVEVALQFKSGYASDQGHKLGRANFTMRMLQQGTKDLDSVAIAKRKQRLGANVSTVCGLDTCDASLNSLADKFGPSLDLLADVVQNPAFRDADVDRIRGKWLARIALEKNRPFSMALRVLPPLLYGEGYPYAMPLTGSGTTASIEALSKDDMRAFMRDYIRPDNVRVFVAGDISMDKLLPALNEALGQWKAPETPVPTQNLDKVTPPKHDRVFLMDRPGSLQSVILAGIVAPSGKAPNQDAISVMNGTFGGTFTSRLNMDLREGKHWAYGAHSFVLPPLGPGMFLMYAPVQSDKTAPSIKEMVKLVHAVAGTKPPTKAEIVPVKAQMVHALPGRFQTNGAVLRELGQMALYDRPDDYVTSMKSRIEKLSNKDIAQAAREVIQPGHFTWVIVGDLSKVGKSIRALKLGPVQVLDASGHPVKAEAKADDKATAR